MSEVMAQYEISGSLMKNTHQISKIFRFGLNWGRCPQKYVIRLRSNLKHELHELLFFAKYGNRFSDITEASKEYSVKIKRELDEIKGFLSKDQAKDLEKFDVKQHPWTIVF